MPSGASTRSTSHDDTDAQADISPKANRFNGPAAASATTPSDAPSPSRLSPSIAGAAGKAVSSRSCHPCHRRKVRCDKKQPCSPCARSGKPCTYPTASQPIRRPRKTTMADVASRISQLERSLTYKASDVVAPSLGDGAGSFSTPLTPRGPRASSDPVHADMEAPAVTTAQEQTPSNSPRSSRTARAADRRTIEQSYNGVCDGGDEDILVQRGSSNQYFNEVLLSRVIEEEQTARSALATPDTHATATNPSSFPPSHLSPDISWASPSPFSPLGILSAPSPAIHLADLHPSKSVAVRLWTSYVDVIDSALGPKLLHIPTDEVRVYRVIEDPSTAPREDIALCFAMYFAALASMVPADGAAVAGERWTVALSRYKSGLEQAFAQGKFLDNPTVVYLQALVTYLSALRLHNHTKSIWILNGLALRAAESVGLHVDPARLGLSPFECERRRRLWWQIQGRDYRAAEDYGIQNTASIMALPPALHAALISHLKEDDGDESNNNAKDVRLPLNVYDEELFPEMTTLPTERPRGTWTPMAVSIIQYDLVKTQKRLGMLMAAAAAAPAEFEVGLPNSPAENRDDKNTGQSGSGIAEANANISDKRYEDIRSCIVRQSADRIEERLKHINPVVPRQRLGREISRLMLRKVDFVSRQQRAAMLNKRNARHPRSEQRRWSTSTSTGEGARPSTSGVSSSAARGPSDAIIAEVLVMSERCVELMHDELFSPYRWLLRSYPQHHVVLYMLWYLCLRPDGTYAERAWRAIDALSEDSKTWAVAECDAPDNGKGAVLVALRAKAEAIRANFEGRGQIERRNSSNEGSGGDHVDGGEPNVLDGAAMPNNPPGQSSVAGLDQSIFADCGDLCELDFALDGGYPDWQWLAQSFQGQDGTDYANLW